MESKNIIEPQDEHDVIPDVRDLLNLPHIEQIKAELAEKVLHATLHNSVDDNNGGLRRRRTDMSVTREEINEGDSHKNKQHDYDQDRNISIQVQQQEEENYDFRNRSKSTAVNQHEL